MGHWATEGKDCPTESLKELETSHGPPQPEEETEGEKMHWLLP